MEGWLAATALEKYGCMTLTLPDGTKALIYVGGEEWPSSKAEFESRIVELLIGSLT